jgi:phosphatidylinositol phospholipase C delta
MSKHISNLVNRLGKLKASSSGKIETFDDEDVGEVIDTSAVAGGGHGARPSEITRNRLRVSQALKSFLVHEGVLSKSQVDDENGHPNAALRALVDKPHIEVPAYITDRSHPLPEYYVSSSHNTYLLAHQLFGTSSATGYEVALNAGARCVEIDAWDNPDDPQEPKVTHGFTLVSHIPFRAVCNTIREVVDREVSKVVSEPVTSGSMPGPILLSLENHCGAGGQLRLVDIMKEVWGDRLLSKPVLRRNEAESLQDTTGLHASLDELGSKIAVIVEYHIPSEADDSDDTSTSDSETDEAEIEEERRARQAYRAKKRSAESSAKAIIPELAALGVYAQSVKPSDNSWYDPGTLRNGPHHHLINLSEVGLRSHMPAQNSRIARHNSNHLMRVFPKGTRISSANLNPVPFWALGAQICALNWQTFGASLQLNEALFSGTAGYVLKPAALRQGGDGVLSTGRKRRLRLTVAGVTDLSVPANRDDKPLKPYVTCTLIHPDGPKASGDRGPKRKTSVYSPRIFPFLRSDQEESPITDPVWDETLEWEFDDNELVFVRILIKSDDSFATNPILAVTSMRLLYVAGGWSFIRMLDLKGRETTCSVLVKFDLEDVD